MAVKAGSRAARCSAAAPEALPFDTLHAAHLRRIGGGLVRRAANGPLLALGASSVAQALVAHWQHDGGLEAAAPVRIAAAGVAGGDTSSLALRRLDVWALGCAGRLADGVTLVRARSDRPRLDRLELMLKGGQMGPPDLFERLLAGA